MNETVPIEAGFAEVNGTRLYYEIAGSGHPLTLSHSAVSHHRMWDDQFLAFAQHYRVIRYDLRGFGSSGLIKEPYSQREDLFALFTYLGIQKTYLLGISMSSMRRLVGCFPGERKSSRARHRPRRGGASVVWPATDFLRTARAS